MAYKVLSPRGKAVLLGNEAIVRGALESGVAFTASYPGTPSSEIGDTFSEIAKDAGVYFEWSVNEKVAVEAAAGAAFSGVRSMSFFKHFGLNVALDSILPLPYYGIDEGMVMLSADDPGGWSSGQNEEDTRRLIQSTHLPYLEPSSPQEAKEFVKLAFNLSLKMKIPVFLRTTTRVNHTRGIVELGRIVKPNLKGFFKKGRQWNTMPPKVIERHAKLHEKLNELEKISESLPVSFMLNKDPKSKFGIIVSGVSFNYVVEALEKLKLKVPVFKVSMWPCPRKKIVEFMKNMEQVLVVEELEPILENEIKRIAQESKLSLKIEGKKYFPSWGELRIENVLSTVTSILKIKWEMKKSSLPTPNRNSILCPGCPHRATFWAVKDALGKDAVFGGDIGCYILGIYEPFEEEDFIVSMGAGIGISHGISKVSDQKIAIFIGDSTFFHAGIPALINMIYNKADATIVVLDNRITAMTGHQPNAGMGLTGMDEQTEEVSIAEIAKACGAQVSIVNPFNFKQTIEAVKEISSKKGVKVIISKQDCRLVFMRNARKQQRNVPIYQIDMAKCNKCNKCVEYGCPAIHVELKGKKAVKYWIDENYCWGCAVCPQICPVQAIQPLVKKENRG